MTSTCSLSPMVLLMLLMLGCCSIGPSAASSLDDSLLPLYSATERFLDMIQPPERSVLLKDVVPDLVSGQTPEIIRGQWNSLTRYWLNAYLGYSILICSGIFLAIFVPLAGCCVCCCRCCCNKCGGKLSYMERKGSSCKRGCYGFLLLIFATAMLFGCVFALLANQQFRDQLSSGRVFNEFSNVADRIADLVESVASRGRNATPGSVADAANELRPRANRSLELFQWRLSTSANGSGIDAIGTFEAVENGRLKLQITRNLTGEYVSAVGRYANSIVALNSTFAEISKNLTVPEFVCPTGASAEECRLVNETVQRLADVGQNPDAVGRQSLSDLMGKLSGLNETAVLVLVRQAKTALANISTVGMEMFDKYIADSLSNLNNSELLAQWNNIDRAVAPLAKSIRRFSNFSDLRFPNPLSSRTENIQEAVAYFDSYRYYLYIGLAAFGLILVALLYMGLIYGCAGQPPYKDSGCCNRGVGANCLLAVVGLGCLLYATLLLFVALFFLSGGLTDTEACRYLTGRTGQYGYNLLDDVTLKALARSGGGGGLGLGNLSIADVVHKPVSTLLNGCNGQSLGSALNISAMVGAAGLPSLINKFINQTVSDLAGRGSEFLSGVSFNISELDELRSLAANGSALNVSEFEAELKKPLFDGTLLLFLNALSNISRDCNASSPNESARFSQMHLAMSKAESAALSSADDLLARLPQLRQAFVDLNSSAASLSDRLTALGADLGSQSLLQSLIYQSALDSGLGSAEQLLSNSSMLPILGALLSASLDCPALGAELRRAIQLPCVSLLRPFNGFWAGLGFCLICLLPCFILCIKLANLYRKMQEYLPDMQDGSSKPV